MERTARTEWIILYPIRSIGDLACEVLPVLPTALGWAQPVVQISNHNKVVYTDFSRPYRLRLEDSVLPGAYPGFSIAAFRGAS